MKKRYWITFILIVFIQLVNAQDKRDNTITAHGFIPYSRIAEILKKEGFSNTNNDTLFIVAEGKPMIAISDLTYIIKRTDTTLVIKGFLVPKGEKNYFNGMPLDFSFGYFKKGFLIMIETCKLFGLPLSYSKEKH